MESNWESEWKLIRDKLKCIALFISNDEKVEAAFLIGCLHEICNENIEKEKIQKKRGEKCLLLKLNF